MGRKVIAAKVVSSGMDALKNRMEGAHSFRSMRKIRSGELTLIEFENGTPDLSSLMKSNPEIKSVAYGLRLGTDDPLMLLAREILLQPKEGIDFQNILNLISGEYEAYEANKYNTYKIMIKNWDKLLSLANEIYERELVNYCHPNFIASIQKTSGCS